MGVVFGYFLFVNTLTSTAILENQEMQDSTINAILADPALRLRIIDEINKNDKFALEFLTNPQSQKLITTTKSFGAGGILGDMRQDDKKPSSENLQMLKYQLDLIKKFIAENDWKNAYSLATLAYVDYFDPISESIYQTDKEAGHKVATMMRDDLREMILRRDNPADINTIIDEIKETLDTLISYP